MPLALWLTPIRFGTTACAPCHHFDNLRVSRAGDRAGIDGDDLPGAASDGCGGGAACLAGVDDSFGFWEVGPDVFPYIDSCLRR